ncbi:LCP family protein [Tessaracoccus antarcticus]|uniref:LytR family transcriptional regulator n=1 Tax=Tessaracoccus antarcticus TaxID=2479848 RepID=A0A3M0GJS8_9ACTN|nr:LCP family protein [Tessaracoccus antarcticus]RMB61883.1 LytR family transcriptional regulator [Tessaracoccus antarcticus]
MTDDTFFRGEDEQPAKGKRRKKRLRERWLLLSIVGVLGVALLVAAAFAGYYGKAAKDALDSIDREPTLMPTSTENRPQPVPTKEGESNPPLNFVLMGTDARNPDERGRSDVLMVMHIPGDRKQAYLISLPRDYWVDIPGRGNAKINAAYSWGGPALTVETVEQLLDIPIDHTAIINFEGFMSVIDALGGVTVVNRHVSSSDGFDFPKGPVELTGESALRFVRERKNLPNGDFDRAERQRDVLKAIVSKLTSRGVLTNPGMFRDAVTTLGPNFTVDTGLDNNTIINLGLGMRINGGDDIKSLMAPTAGFGTSADKQSYVKVDGKKLDELATALRTDTMAEYYAANG